MWLLCNDERRETFILKPGFNYRPLTLETTVLSWTMLRFLFGSVNVQIWLQVNNWPRRSATVATPVNTDLFLLIFWNCRSSVSHRSKIKLLISGLVTWNDHWCQQIFLAVVLSEFVGNPADFFNVSRWHVTLTGSGQNRPHKRMVHIRLVIKGGTWFNGGWS